MERKQAILTIEAYCTFVIGDIIEMEKAGETVRMSNEQMCASVMVCDLMDTYEITPEDLWVGQHPTVQKVCKCFVQDMLQAREGMEEVVWAPRK